MKATVKWFNDARGFGYLTAEDENEYFVHYNAIQAGDKPDNLDAACKLAVAHLSAALREGEANCSQVEALNDLWERVHEHFASPDPQGALNFIERTLNEIRVDYAKKNHQAAVADFIKKALGCLGGYYYRTLKEGDVVEILGCAKTFQGLKATRVKKC